MIIKESPEEVLNKLRISFFTDDWLRDGMRVNRLFGLKELIDK